MSKEEDLICSFCGKSIEGSSKEWGGLHWNDYYKKNIEESLGEEVI